MFIYLKSNLWMSKRPTFKKSAVNNIASPDIFSKKGTNIPAIFFCFMLIILTKDIFRLLENNKDVSKIEIMPEIPKEKMFILLELAIIL